METIDNAKIAFERWVKNNLPNFDNSLLLDFHQQDGYTRSDIVNAMWIGFFAAYQDYAFSH